jgi:hypothetical protein
MGDILQPSAHTGNSTAITKKGIQQTTKAPVMMASVLAAFRSRFELVSLAVGVFFFSIEGFVFASLPNAGGFRGGFFHDMGIGCGGQLTFEGYATEILSEVGGSMSIRSSSPLP